MCYTNVDVFIILDSFSSIGEESYKIAKEFVADIVNGFTISENNTRVGLVIYSNTAHIEFDLNDSFDQATILYKIRNIPHLKQDTATLNLTTATVEAIMLMVNNGFTEARGARPPHLAIPRIGIVLTGGATNEGLDVHVAAQAARHKSIKMFAVGFGHEVNDSQLLEIAGSQDRKFTIENFNNFDDARALITQGSCKGELIDFPSMHVHMYVAKIQNYYYLMCII